MKFLSYCKHLYGIFKTLNKKTSTLNVFNLYLFAYKLTENKLMNSKPPNILVYTGNTCAKAFKSVESNLLKCLKTDHYIVYHLLPSEIDTHPWMENSLLLVVSSDTIERRFVETFESYLKNYGNILVVCSKFNGSFLGNKCDEIRNEESLVQISYKDFDDSSVFRGKYSYYSNGAVLCWDKSKKPLMRKITFNKNILILSEIFVDRIPSHLNFPSNSETDKLFLILKDILDKEFGLKVKCDHFVPSLSHGYFINIKHGMAMDSLKAENISSEKSLFNECNIKHLEETVKMPIYFFQKDTFCPLNFNINLYFSSLNTDLYGQSIVYFPVITTTMEVAQQLPDHEGIVITADYQISGKGRGTNKWVSPVGCAMFTLHFTVLLSSQLGQKLSLLQHMAALAVVYGIKSHKMYQEIELKIKWPNDIYHNEIKIGGLIVESVIQKDRAHINIGWGINVSNSNPTMCINDIIDNYNSKNSCSLPHIHTEELIAFTISQMEFFVKDFIDHGSEKFYSYYYSYWMHGDKNVTLSDLNQKGTIKGLDEYGFLKIETDNGKILVFQPDNNRFDIRKNLIHSK